MGTANDGLFSLSPHFILLTGQTDIYRSGLIVLQQFCACLFGSKLHFVQWDLLSGKCVWDYSLNLHMLFHGLGQTPTIQQSELIHLFPKATVFQPGVTHAA